MEFAGKTVMITGGGSGMGALSGIRFAEAGANIALLDVNETALEETAEKNQKSRWECTSPESRYQKL